ncbi:putative FMN dependent dehydrogenase [Xylaria sp. FL0064]|nr:putative FMN dependent dehydrogenase [Xylaria sp. FL0064]
MPITLPEDSNDYVNESSVYQKDLSYERPPFTFKPLEWERLAAERMSADSKGYVVGSAGTGETARKNHAAYARWSIIPKRLVKTSSFPDLSACALGQKFPLPIACAPVSVQRIFNPDGEMAAAAAAAKQRVPYIMSTASSTSIEDNDIALSILDRAQKAGFSALFVALDTYILGWRPSDMDNGYNPFLRSDQVGVAIGLTDPAFRDHFEQKHGKCVEEDMNMAVAEWTHTVFPGHSHSFEDIKFLQKHWKGPIVLKGIQSVEDAQRCVDIGVRGIVVSNHGGRQSDGGCSSLGVLPRIVDVVGDKIDVFDSGIRCGADIAKALALGAKMCLIGRPYIYGLALGGEDGVSHVLKALLGDLELTLHLAGICSTSPEHLNRSVLIKEDDLF